MTYRPSYERPRSNPWMILGWLILIGLGLVGLLFLATCVLVMGSVPR